MYQILKKNWDKTKQLVFLGFVITGVLLLTVVYKNDQKVSQKIGLSNNSDTTTDLKALKEFLLNQIKSPFAKLSYEIVKGDTIQKILKKQKIKILKFKLL